jgi:hypothetical protein
MISTDFISKTQNLTVSERREVISRLVAEQTKDEVGIIWKTVKFSENLRVVAYTPEQNPYLDELYNLLKKGTLIRIENQEDGNCEVFGIDRTYYVTLSEKREFAGLLSSWKVENSPQEIEFEI